MSYPKPPGYNVQTPPAGYKVFNNYISGSQNYAPGSPSAQRVTFTFSAAPDDLSQITVPDGPVNLPGGPNVKTFTFTYGGSPGAGIIPLVMGGGTAAQAATAAYTAMLAQLENWTPTNPTPTVLVLESLQRGVTLGPGLVGNTHAALSGVASTFGEVLPARFGKNYAVLSATPGPTVGS
jgi:hypothetical protein